MPTQATINVSISQPAPIEAVVSQPANIQPQLNQPPPVQTSQTIFPITANQNMIGVKGDPGEKGEKGASIIQAAFTGDDIIFTKDDSNTVVLPNAKIELKGDKGDRGEPGAGGEIIGGVEGNLVGIDASGFIEDSGVAPADFAPALGSDDNYVTDAEKVILANTSGVNTGDQDLSSYATKTGIETLTNKTINANDNTLTNIIPAGTINMFGGSSAPTGWLICNGNAVSRTTYSSLFSIIGTTYGTGDGSTTFNLPNLKGKVVVGLDSGDTSFDVLGETGGAKTHTLTTAEMPSHTHVQNSHSHTNYGALIPRGTGGNFRELTVSPGSNNVNSGSTTAVNQDTGGGLAHNNLQPYITLNYIIKT